MKIRKASFLCLSALFVIAAGCGADKSAVPAGPGASSSEAGSPPSVSSAASAPSAGSEAASDASAVSSAAPNPAGGAQTQQEVPSQVKAALNTKVPVMLPTSVPVGKGYLTAAAASQTASYKVSFYQTDRPVKVNSQDAAKGALIATVEGTGYKDAASAQESINNYRQVDLSRQDDFLDLGHNIKAMAEGSAGSQELRWNEGRWYLNVDSPTDPAFKNKDYPDGDQLAKNVVAYLDQHMLPAPQKIGVIEIVIWNPNDDGGTPVRYYGTTVTWQENQTVYQVSAQDPMTALKVAVAMKK